MKFKAIILNFALLILIFLSGCEKSTGPKKDTTPPAAITDLRIVANTETPVTLAWTAPGDDGSEGIAAWYFIRYSSDSSIIAEWDFAHCVLDKPTPKLAGTAEDFVVSYLSPDSNYYFAIRSEDDAGNLSALSNIASGSPIAGGGIAFVSDGAIFVVNSDGSHLKRISSQAPAWDPAWSWDRKIVFASSETWRASDIFVQDSDGWHQQRLTFEKAPYCCSPVFSPDGSKIAFLVLDYRPPLDHYCDIYMMYSDGSYLKNLTEESGHRDLQPSWSPDGRKMAFVSSRDQNYEIYVMNWDGSNQHRLTDNEGPDVRPMWSPDGKQILYISGPDYVDYDIWVMKTDGTDQRRLTMDGTSVYAVWSPDGTRIVYESGGDVYVMSSNGSNQRQLTTDPGYDGRPAWSPDGTKMAFVTDRDGNHEIYVMNVDGTSQRNVSHRSANDSNPVWSHISAPRWRDQPYLPKAFPEADNRSTGGISTHPSRR